MQSLPQVTVPDRKSSRLMPWLVSGAAGVALGLGAGWLVFAPTPADAEVAALIDDYIAAWDAGDGAAAVSLMTEDGVHYSADAQQGKAANDDGALGLAALVERIGWATLEPVGDPIISEGPPTRRPSSSGSPSPTGRNRSRPSTTSSSSKTTMEHSRSPSTATRSSATTESAVQPSGCSSRAVAAPLVHWDHSKVRHPRRAILRIPTAPAALRRESTYWRLMQVRAWST